MGHLKAEPTRNLECPRCGYDQRGVVETWTGSCPLRGRCTECGLEFAWWEVMRPELRLPEWCIEYARRKRAIPFEAVRTFLASFWPWYFWRRLRMSHPVRPRRLAAYVLLLILPVLFMYVAEQSAVAIRVRMLADADLRTLQAMVRGQIAAVQRGQTLPAQDVEAWRRALAASRIEMSYRDAVGEALLHPLNHTSKGLLHRPFPNGAVQYTAPSNLHDVLVSGRFGSARALPDFGSSTFRRNLTWVAAWLVIAALLPLSFILLPFSARAAKVRRRHLARVFAYSLFIPSSVTVVLLVSMALVAIVPTLAVCRVLLQIGPPLASFGAGGMLLFWWYAAIKRHLRIRHAEAVTILLMVVCLLASSLVWVLIWIEANDFQ